MSGSITPAVDDAVAVAMRSRGWRSVGECWLRQLTGDVEARAAVGLSGRDEVDANPMVGVRHAAVEQLASPGELATPTLLRPLYEVISDNGTYRTWTFRSGDLVGQATALADAIEDALPVLRDLTKLSMIEAALREWSYADVRRAKLPATLILLGEMEKAHEVVQRELDTLRAAGDTAVAADYEQTAARLLRAGPSG